MKTGSKSRQPRSGGASGIDFRRLFDTLESPCMIMDRAMNIVFANAAFLNTIERSAEELLGRNIFDAFPDVDERVALVRERFEACLAGNVTHLHAEPYQFEHRDGTISTRYWRTQQTPYRDASGEVTHIVQIAEDVTETVKLEAANAIISKELDHRVKNMFSVILALTAMSGRNAESVADFRQSFTARLTAMSRTYTALSNSSWNGLTLREIFDAELAQYRMPKQRLSLEGKPVALTQKSTQDASMLIHELATNAAKYGCFSTPEGRLDVSWRVTRKPYRLHVTWREYGMSGVRPPERTGFGSQLISWMPNIEFERTFRDEGVLIELSVPGEIAIASAGRRTRRKP